MAAKEEPKMSLASLREKLKILQIQSNAGASGVRLPDTPSSTTILKDIQLNSGSTCVNGTKNENATDVKVTTTVIDPFCHIVGSFFRRKDLRRDDSFVFLIPFLVK